MTLSLPWRIWLLCFLSLACFCQLGENSNLTTRIALALSIVQDHALTIDRFAPYTIDKAQSDGHTYADKAPGLSLLAVPAAAVASTVLDLQGPPYNLASNGRPAYHVAYRVLIGLVTLLVEGTAVATAAALLWRWLRSRGVSVAGASFGSLGWALATPVMWWSTLYVGHAPAAAALLIGFVLLSDAFGPERRPGRAVGGGLVLGLAFAIEFPAAAVVAMAAACCLAEAVAARRPWPRIAETVGLATAGLLVPLAAVAWYNAAAFGGPFHLGYSAVQGFPGMRQGFFGISAPNPHAAFSLLVGLYRGLLPLAPILLLAPFGLVIGLREPAWRPVTLLAILAFLYYWMLNAGYYYWAGGDSTGPRQLVPGLTFLPVALALCWDRMPRPARPFAVALLLLGAAIAALLAGMDVTAPEYFPRPIANLFLPMLAAGAFPRATLAQLGLPAPLALLPVPLLWLALARPLFATAATATASPPAPPAPTATRTPPGTASSPAGPGPTRPPR